MKIVDSAGQWIDAYLQKKPPEFGACAQPLVKKGVQGSLESVNPWKIRTFDANGPMYFSWLAKNHITFGFLHGTPT
jgi:hypothetical protein